MAVGKSGAFEDQRRDAGPGKRGEHARELGTLRKLTHGLGEGIGVTCLPDRLGPRLFQLAIAELGIEQWRHAIAAGGSEKSFAAAVLAARRPSGRLPAQQRADQRYRGRSGRGQRRIVRVSDMPQVLFDQDRAPALRN